MSGSVQYADIVDSANFAVKEIEIKEDSSVNFKTNIGTWNIHTITIKGLKPCKTYCYRVGYDNNWSDKSTFNTESSEIKSFRFLIFGDSQSGSVMDANYTAFATTIHNAYKANPTSKFFINMGDLVEVGGDYKHWNSWFDATKDIINKIPIMPVVGNHETYTITGEEGNPVNFIRQFNLPRQNVPDEYKGQIYSYDYGNVHFAVWDSQIEEEKPNDSTLRKELDWLQRDLKTTDKMWKVMLFHKTPYYNKITRSNDVLKNLLQPIIDSSHVDLVINGHDHVISWTFPIKDDKFMEKPSQGAIYYIAGRSGNKRYDDLESKVWNANFYIPFDEPNYVVAEANGTQFKLTAYKQDMTPIDTLIIDKLTDKVFPVKVPAKFNNTRLVIYGNILADTVKPINKDNAWYIPAQAFVDYLHGKSSKNDKIIKISIEKSSGEFTIMHYLQNMKTDMISAEEIRVKLGFKCVFDKSMNMLLLSKDRKT